MSILDGLNDDKLALIASALRKWSNALDHAGLNPMMHVTDAETGVVTELISAFPTERAVADDKNH